MYQLETSYPIENLQTNHPVEICAGKNHHTENSVLEISHPEKSSMRVSATVQLLLLLLLLLLALYSDQQKLPYYLQNVIVIQC